MRKKSTKKGKKFFLLCENFDKYRKNGQKTCKIAFVMIVFICFAIEGDGKVSATLYVDFSEVLMKIKAKRRFVQVIALLMAFTVAVTFTDVVYPDAASSQRVEAAVAAGLTDVTGTVDVDGLREQYYNDDVVSKNVFSPKSERWVIVELGGDSIMDTYLDTRTSLSFTDYTDSYAATKKSAAMLASHQRFLDALDKKGIDYEYKYSYTALNNGVAIKIKNEDLAKVRSVNNVKGVYYSEFYAVPDMVAVTNNANVYTTGIYDTTGISYQGRGMVVAILDTGLDYSHPAFSIMPEDGDDIWDKEYVESRFGSTMAKNSLAPDTTVEQVYYNAKVPYAFDYADDDPDVYPSYSTHGTHVAGIVAGKDDGKVVNAETDERFVGVAPEAQLAIMKVFTDDPDSEMLGGADTIDILAAINDCVALGVDVINMSLGSSAGFSDDESDAYLTGIYNKVEEAGISLVVAASNDYSAGFGGGNGTNLASDPDSGTVGSPSTYSAALSVASINGQKSPYIMANADASGEGTVAFITEASDANGNELDFVGGIFDAAKANGVALNPDGSLTLQYVLVGGVGRQSNYTTTVRNNLKRSPSIALVKRGDITFEEKVQYAMSAGAIGVIIYNNLSGTIRMSLGEVENPVPTCSIGMDAGKLMETAANSNSPRGTGTVTFSRDYTAGPFMSDFSSWGPTPDLKLKPEITAHGGEITSAVPGGYDEYSGTSMAAPNMAGAVALLRQHVESSEGLSGKALNAKVNQLLMSTATIALNEEGNPYSPRKQGAGLAGIKEAINTDGYITVSDKEGNVLDKTKLELGDDKSRTGVYEMKFTVRNMKDSAITYSPKAYVMTETLASDNKTVAEKAYMLADSKTEFKADGAAVAEGGIITVPASGSVEVSVKITLGADGKAYIENSFKNGMYVEGFIRLDKGTASEDIGIPFLAFYGDWTDGPLFDYSMYEIAESEADTSIEEEDKLKASNAPTRPLGLYDDDQYIIALGSYLYEMSDFDTEIPASDEYAAISAYDEEGNRTLYELYMVYAGLLRGAKTMDINITDSATGELIYSKTEHNVRKAYAAGGANLGSPVMLEIDPLFYGLNNNSSYTVTMSGSLDYEGGETPERNSFTFDFTVDYEAPVITDYRIRFEPYTENKEVKYRIYMDVDVYDNHYAQAVLPCYVKSTNTGNYLTLLTEYPVPVYSQKGSTTTVSFEITDYYDEYATTGNLYVAVDDYAMNQTVYRVNAASAVTFPDSVEITTDDKLSFKETVTEKVDDADVTYNVYTLNLAPNESYKATMTALPDSTEAAGMYWKIDRQSIVRGYQNEFFGANAGSTTATLYASTDSSGAAADKIKAKIEINVSGTAKEAPVPESIKIEPILNADDYLADVSGGVLELNPNTTVNLRSKVTVEPWYLTGVSYKFESRNPAVASVTGAGVLTSHKKGSTYVTVTATAGGISLSKSLMVTVGEDFYVNSYYLYDYYGGPEVVIPDDLNVMYLDKDCFRNNTTITKVVLPTTLAEIPEEAFSGCTNLKEVVIPSECTVVGEKAFAGCVSLEKIVLQKFTDKVNNAQSTGAITIGKYAFDGCRSLTEIENQQRLTTAYDYAFRGCSALESIDLSGLRVAGSFVFQNCTSLTSVTTDANTVIGAYMFMGCTSLPSFDIKASRVENGAFQGCSSLENLTFSTSDLNYVGDYAFYGTAISSLTLPAGNYSLGAYAFGYCASLTSVTLSDNTFIDKSKDSPFAGCSLLSSFTAPAGNPYYSSEGGLLFNKDKTRLELVPVGYSGSLTLPEGVTKVGDGAFSGISGLTSVDLTGVTAVGAYAFSGSGLTSLVLPDGITVGEGAFKNCKNLTSVDFGSLTAVPAYAFQNCTSLTSVNLAGMTTVGDGAFSGSGLTSVTADNLVNVGKEAFSSTKLSSVNFGSVATLGDGAFAGIAPLTSVTLGGVTEMGRGVFENSPRIESVTFGDGTLVVGDYAFGAVNSERTALTSVSLPDSLESVGDYAFYGAVNLTSLNLSGVKFVGDYAFYGDEKLAGVDLAKAEYVGDYAFYGAKALSSANLASATEIGDYAFYGSALNSVTLGKAEKLGKYSFASTALTEVTLPASLDELTYDDSWYRIGSNGDPELMTGKKTARFGIGAFSDIPTLTAINVEEGNPVFTSVDGVLYSRAASGLRLEQYPAGKADTSYRVADGTVRIGDSAFEGSVNLVRVEMPYTVYAIGSYAFFDSSVTDYVFESVEAPVLESTYVDPATLTDQTLINAFTEADSNDVAHTANVFYANFKDYVARVTEAKYLATLSVFYEAPDFGLSITRPINGKGYDTVIWKGFFTTENYTAYAADRTTKTAIDMIAALPSASEINAILSSDKTDEEKKTAVTELSVNEIQPARKQFNLVTDPAQAALIENSANLYAAEEAVRAVKSALGIDAVMTSLVMVQRPDKINYVAGESFDPTGMIIKAVYDDLSEVILSDYDVDKTVLNEGDGEVTVSYGGKTCVIYIDVQAAAETPGGNEGGQTPGGNEGTQQPEKPTGLGGAAIAGIVIGAAIVAAAIVAAVIVVVKRRRKK